MRVLMEARAQPKSSTSEWLTILRVLLLIYVAINRCLHLASCRHFKFRETDDIKFAPKCAALNREELDVWARNEIGKTYLICSDCKP